MEPATLIADGGSTKTEWCLIQDGRKKSLFTQGMSPYFYTSREMTELLAKELLPRLKEVSVETLYYYGTGCASPTNARSVRQALEETFPDTAIEVNTDLVAAARAVCGHGKGIACILGTGSNSCFFNGEKIVRNSPGLGYVLGDEGSGAYLGKKVLQYYLYNTFDDDLRSRFDAMFTTTAVEVLDNIYSKPLPNRYLATFAMFLAENRGHFMVENILEDGLNDFFFQHLCKYPEVWTHPVNFVGSIAYGFSDVLEQLCHSYEFELGKILKNPMQGLVNYHGEEIKS
ncbi:N-acetylglucosamine kinase [Paraflavisolibacter sp. H34]|uniref:N-acetylglucosamine kinase n=1 Tax=Huijunlia imazamoxiresistens TaxID=3127457 RepID=UPI00301B270F